MRYLMIAAAVVAVACGGDKRSTPTAPTPQPVTNIAGNWTGTATFTPFNGGQRTIIAVTATFTQAGSNVTGQFNTGLADRTAATTSGTISGNSMAMSMQFANNAGCTGSASVTATFVTNTIRFVIPTVASTNCSWFTNTDVVLNR